jgi:hypothetical protein
MWVEEEDEKGRSKGMQSIMDGTGKGEKKEKERERKGIGRGKE